MAQPVRAITGRPIVWHDGNGIVHCCEGLRNTKGELHIWTFCGCAVPPTAAFLPERGEEITCRECLDRAYSS